MEKGRKRRIRTFLAIRTSTSLISLVKGRKEGNKVRTVRKEGKDGKEDR